MHPGQYGRLPGQDCTEIKMLEESRLDFPSLILHAFTNLDTNLTDLYDRILCSLNK